MDVQICQRRRQLGRARAGAGMARLCHVLEYRRSGRLFPQVAGGCGPFTSPAPAKSASQIRGRTSTAPPPNWIMSQAWRRKTSDRPVRWRPSRRRQAPPRRRRSCCGEIGSLPGSIGTDGRSARHPNRSADRPRPSTTETRQQNYGSDNYQSGRGRPTRLVIRHYRIRRVLIQPSSVSNCSRAGPRSRCGRRGI